jgi:DNA polymerase I-like protein with 3'-5' exonuclease and polymerase domains
MLIQGSGAYFLKSKIIEIDRYLADKHSRFQMNIHDELSFIWDERDDFSIFYDIKRIMETWEDCMVPIVADMEITHTNWAEKEEVA